MVSVVTNIKHIFSSNGSAANASAMAAYMRGQHPFYGLKSPERRALSRAAIAEAKSMVLDSDRVDFQVRLADDAAKAQTQVLDSIVKACWALDEREMHYFAIDVLGAVCPKIAARESAKGKVSYLQFCIMLGSPDRLCFVY